MDLKLSFDFLFCSEGTCLLLFLPGRSFHIFPIHIRQLSKWLHTLQNNSPGTFSGATNPAFAHTLRITVRACLFSQQIYTLSLNGRQIIMSQHWYGTDGIEHEGTVRNWRRKRVGFRRTKISPAASLHFKIYLNYLMKELKTPKLVFWSE